MTLTIAIKSVRTVEHLVQWLAMVDLNATLPENIPHLRNKTIELLSDNARDNAVLLLTRSRYSLDVLELVNRLPESSCQKEDADILFRALAETGHGISMAKMCIDYLQTYLEPTVSLANRQVCNVLCGIAKFARNGQWDDFKTFEIIAHHMINQNLQEYKRMECMDVAVSIAGLDNLAAKQLLDVIVKRVQLDAQSAILISVQDLNYIWLIDKQTNWNNVLVEPQDIAKLIIALGQLRHCSCIDNIIVHLWKHLPHLSLKDLSRISCSLAQLNYENKSFLYALCKYVKLHIQGDNMLMDAHIITNLFTGLSKLGYKKVDIYESLSDLISMEEVLAQLQAHDAVAIIQAHARIGLVNEKLFGKMHNILKQPKSLNTTLAIKTLIAHGKMRYTNPKIQNYIINAININEIQEPTVFQRLELAIDRLGLFMPELKHDKEREFNPPKMGWKPLLGSFKISRPVHVRKRKWNW